MYIQIYHWIKDTCTPAYFVLTNMRMSVNQKHSKYMEKLTETIMSEEDCEEDPVFLSVSVEWMAVKHSLTFIICALMI